MAALAASAGESKDSSDDPILDKTFNGKTGQQIIDELLEKPVFVEDDYVLSVYFEGIDVVDEAFDDFLSLYAYYVNRIDEGRINEIDKEKRRESLEAKINSYLDTTLQNVTIREKDLVFSNVTGRSKERQEALNKKKRKLKKKKRKARKRKKKWERALRRLSDIEKSKQGKNNVTFRASQVRLRL